MSTGNVSYPIRPRHDMPIEEQQARLAKMPDVQSVKYYASQPHFFRVEFPDYEHYTGRTIRTLCATALDADPDSLRTY